MSVTVPRGFEAAGIAAGIKADGAADLAMICTADRRPVTAAGVFTTNLVQAAPVTVSRAHLADGRAAAVILNSGNANAATGEPGRRDATRMCSETGEALGLAPTDVLVCSTGLIGYTLPMDTIQAAIPALVAALGDDAADAEACARAMMTTDTYPKQALAPVDTGSVAGHVGGVAKGAAMLAPSMATMLAVLTTDVAATADVAQRALADAVGTTFDRLIVDGSRSTNDTVLVLANGAAANPLIDAPRGSDYHALVDAMRAVCGSLAEQMARDAEGATKFARIVVEGARNDAEALLGARQVASSQLVQCSLYGNDPYWGRVVSELGASGCWFDPEAVEVAYNDIVVCRGGVASDHDEAALATAMAGRDIVITCRLRQGHGRAEVLFSDLTHAYVDENMGTS